MTWHEYRVSQLINDQHYPFYALVMAAMRSADTTNVAILKDAFPWVWTELDDRYNAPDGVLASDGSKDYPIVMDAGDIDLREPKVIEPVMGFSWGSEPAPRYACPVCKMVSFNPGDIAAKYCGRCHKFEDDR
jgi:hypothetical protein